MTKHTFTTVEELKKSFPQAFKESGDVDFTGIAGAKEIFGLPERWEVKRDLTLIDMPFLREVPKGLSVGRSFRLVRCDAVSTLPSDLSVRNDQNTDLGYGICIVRCSSFTTIEDRVCAPHSIYVEDCHKFSTLPKFVRGGTLTVIRCPSLMEPPEEVDVCQLTLIDCPDLTSLPQRLSFTTGVAISNCPKIRDLPEISDFKGAITAKGSGKISGDHPPQG